MPRLRLHALLVFSAVLGSALSLHAQDAPPAGPPPGGQPRGPRPAPTNIKALPKTISGDEVNKLMRQYTGDLGVQCAFCHAKNPETGRSDYPSDANHIKETARSMIRMTADLNTKYLATLDSPKDDEPVTCGTCHRGEAHPPAFAAKQQERPAGGPPSATPGSAPKPPM